MIARLLVAAGAVLAVPQLAAAQPWQAGFAAGMALAGIGAVLICDEAA